MSVDVMDVTFSDGSFGSCNVVTEVLAHVGHKWSVQVVICLRDGPCYFNQLKRMVGGISQRMLSRTMRLLERDGLVSRTVIHSAPLRVQYELTDLGHSLEKRVKLLGIWAVENRGAILEARGKFDAFAA